MVRLVGAIGNTGGHPVNKIDKIPKIRIKNNSLFTKTHLPYYMKQINAITIIMLNK